MAYKFGDITKGIIKWLQDGNEWHKTQGKKYHFFSAGEDTIGTSSLPKKITEGVKGLTDWSKEQVEASTGAGANATNKEIAEQNLGFEREKLDYDKALQQEIFKREDTANQRTVNDMRMAGLNPLNMQGTNGSGEVVSTTAPHNDYQMQSTQTLQILNTIFNSALQAKATQSNNSLQQANANLINEQAQNQKIKNLYEADILSSSLAGTRYDNNIKWLDVTKQLDNMLFNAHYGWTENTPEWMKQSSARFNWKPYSNNKNWDDGLNELLNPMKNPDSQYYWYEYPTYTPGGEEVSKQLLSDELLQGSLGIFGNVLKLLTK